MTNLDKKEVKTFTEEHMRLYSEAKEAHMWRMWEWETRGVYGWPDEAARLADMEEGLRMEFSDEEKYQDHLINMAIKNE